MAKRAKKVGPSKQEREKVREARMASLVSRLHELAGGTELIECVPTDAEIDSLNHRLDQFVERLSTIEAVGVSRLEKRSEVKKGKAKARAKKALAAAGLTPDDLL